MHYRTRVAVLAETFTETQLVDIAPVCHGMAHPARPCRCREISRESVLTAAEAAKATPYRSYRTRRATAA